MNKILFLSGKSLNFKVESQNQKTKGYNLAVSEKTTISLEESINNLSKTFNEESSSIIVFPKVTKKKRTSKKDFSSSKYNCDICKKRYLSYAALYTHNRNKHNVIPITSRPEIFKISFHKQKFNYTKKAEALEDFNEYDLLGKIKDEFISLNESVLSDDKSSFYIQDVNLRKTKIKENSFLNLLENYIERKNFNLDIPSSEDLMKANINNVLIKYAIKVLKIITDDFYLKIMIKFIFYLREYLNIAGWELMKRLSYYNIITLKYSNEEFCLVNTCWEIPYLIEDFIYIFIDINNLQQFQSELLDISSNFCHWLLINNLTNLKILANKN